MLAATLAPREPPVSLDIRQLGPEDLRLIWSRGRLDGALAWAAAD